MHHEYLLLRLYSCNHTVVTDAYQQSAPIGIGKSRHRLSKFGSIGNLILEVLLLMFAFCYQTTYIAAFIHNSIFMNLGVNPFSH